MKLSTIPVAIIMAVLYLICPIILRLAFKNRKVTTILAIIMLMLFMFPLIVGVFTNVSVTREIINISFETSDKWASENINLDIFSLSTFDLCVNTIMLLPIGVVISLFKAYKSPNTPLWKKIIHLFLIGLSLGLIIELFQFFLPIERAIQLSDVILNAISCVLGGLYFSLLLKINLRPNKN